MRRQQVRPHEGIDPVRLGMTIEQARDALVPLEPQRDLRLVPFDAEGLALQVDGQAFFVYGSPDGSGVVSSVDVMPADGVAVLLDDVDVFRTPVDDLIATLRERHEVTVSDDGLTVELPLLGVTLWRHQVPDPAAEDPDDGRYFRSVSVEEP